ncbi:MAG: FKBP-type peptidyl-prolyl cis-trans isomerase [Spirochaetaceae bacterium]|nr:FKBP-type peptidyl-prolyl cis-trans isomerase [Spirochaetaceae bacterium]
MVNAIRQGDRINQVTIIRNGPDAAAFKADQGAFDTLLRAAETARTSRAKVKRDADIAQIQAKYPAAAVTPSGIRYVIQKEGTGDKPAKGKTVALAYKGMFLSGNVFDGSDMNGGPLEVQIGIGKLIPGLEETVLDMRLNEKRLVVIPPELAYGERDIGDGIIPGNSFLVFEIDLVRIR